MDTFTAARIRAKGTVDEKCLAVEDKLGLDHAFDPYAIIMVMVEKGWDFHFKRGKEGGFSVTFEQPGHTRTSYFVGQIDQVHNAVIEAAYDELFAGGNDD